MSSSRALKAIICAFWIASIPIAAAAQDEASGLFVGARALYTVAQTKPENERLGDYQGIRRLLDLIVEQYPSSDLAVSILLQDTIDGLDVAEVDAVLAEANSDRDNEAEQSEIVVEPSVSVPEPVEQEAEAQSDEPKDIATLVEEPERTEKEIVADVQTELNRIGCPAGSADGVVGRKTKSAFSNFIKDSGIDLSIDDLATEQAVAILKSQDGTICKVRTMASTPASALAGGWGFRSECPGFGNRIIRNTGSMNLSYTGNNTLRGSARNKQGNTGSAVIQFQGSRTAATIIKFGFVTVKGNLYRSKSNMTISGTGSNRCKIVAWKN